MSKNIYVVEDNDDIRELVQYLLESEGYAVTGFANVTDFNTQFAVAKPDMLVLDVMLPDGNGMDVGNKVKGNEATKDIPILLMSANTNVNYISKESLADDFIAKPFDIDDLVARIAKLLN
ncbi:response regulator [Pedobacter polaris]|uniref:Response regulator n=1 Tax=Pedobacter polaris TaxID=2571273 RepID=A0A4V5P1U6_9SPHI|nr:response regulator transcription factor [Pedobacter polaris]TKC08395.1 response regulator [Pedobacter polaris]